MSRPREFDINRALHQSMEVFWKKGYRGTSLDDLTETTNVKKQSLYGAFQNKHNLYVQSLQYYSNTSGDSLKKLVSQAENPLAQLHAIRDYVIGDDSVSTSLGCLIVNAVLECDAKDVAVREEVYQMFSSIEQLLENIIAQGQRDHLFITTFSSAELAATLSNAIIGARIMEKSGASFESVKQTLMTSFALIEV